MSAIGISHGTAVADRPPEDWLVSAIDSSPRWATYEAHGSMCAVTSRPANVTSSARHRSVSTIGIRA